MTWDIVLIATFMLYTCVSTKTAQNTNLYNVKSLLYHHKAILNDLKKTTP